MPGALPRDAVGTSGEARETLLLQGDSVGEVAEGKRDRAAELIDGTDLTPDEQASLSIEDEAERIREAARELLGASFGLLPEFTVTNEAELAAAAAFRDAPHVDGLLRFSAGPLVVEEWLQGAQRVREKVGVLESVRTMTFAFGRHELGAKALQLPFRDTDHWIAVGYPAPGPDQPFVPEGEFLSLIQVLGPPFDPSQKQVGFVIDEWTEVIPSAVETTGIAVHYDQPSSEPPQCLLLAVTPEETGTWTWADLVAVLHDTLDRAQKRGVEPDQLGRGAFGHLLPGVMTAVTPPPFATISTDLLHQTGSARLEPNP